MSSINIFENLTDALNVLYETEQKILPQIPQLGIYFNLWRVVQTVSDRNAQI
jgi:hypothetical protein